ncbi:Uncharacterized membrane protein [Halobiforma haloterrestris]|uniref:Uncharacterized membrane protein n=1 Tax=Natronobacterium haloterrestre TaxID=148448 RepID=A0A1I1F192_NATHA|nr:DUF1616 domain-containing protein [Halobiforma haloterrestris]SFB93027.1 Uncharacterized membrane protein [Halobiforma haloterrestris]
MKERLIRTVRPLGVGRRPFAGVPTDLVGLTGFALAAATLLAVVDVSSPVVRAAVGAPLLFLAPGYAVVSALFPRARGAGVDTGTDTDGGDGSLIGQTGSPTDVERPALAFGLSFAVLPLLGLGIAALSWRFETTTIVGTVTGFVLVTTAFAAVRRIRVAPRDRYCLGLGGKLRRLRAAIFGSRSLAATAINLVLVVSVLLALTSVGYGLAAPQDGERYTDLRLLTEDESGEYVVGDHADSVEPGESIPVTVAVENQEGESMEYTVVVQEQWVAEDGTVLERNDLRRVDYSVADGATALGDREVTPEAESGEVRIAVMLFDGDAPEDPTTDDAYRHAHFWVEIEDEPAAE